MLYYHPNENAQDHPTQTLHGLFNQAVQALGVVCTGSKDGCLYFERMAGVTADRGVLAEAIIRKLNSNDEIEAWARREHITKIAIK